MIPSGIIPPNPSELLSHPQLNILLEDALKELAHRMGTNRVRVVAYHPPNETRRNLYMSGHPTPPTLGPSPALGAPDLATATLRALLSRPGFHYLWWPGLRSLGD